MGGIVLYAGHEGDQKINAQDKQMAIVGVINTRPSGYLQRHKEAVESLIGARRMI